MNRKQKVAIMVGGLLVLVAVVFPPMDTLDNQAIVDGPGSETGDSTSHPIAIDWDSLGLFALLVLALTATTVLALRDKKA